MSSKENDSYSFTIKDKEKKKKHLFIVAALTLAGIGQSPAYGVEQSDMVLCVMHGDSFSLTATISL